MRHEPKRIASWPRTTEQSGVPVWEDHLLGGFCNNNVARYSISCTNKHAITTEFKTPQTRRLVVSRTGVGVNR